MKQVRVITEYTTVVLEADGYAVNDGLLDIFNGVDLVATVAKDQWIAVQITDAEETA